MPEGLAIVRQDGFGNRTFFRLVDVPVLVLALFAVGDVYVSLCKRGA